MTRLPVCSHAVQVRILDMVRAGETIGAACAASGIPTTTLYRAAAGDELLTFHLRLALDDGRPFRAPWRRLARVKPARPTREERQRRATRVNRGWCADALCGACRSCRRRASTLAQWAGVRRVKLRVDPRAWTAAEEALLRRHAGRLSPTEIAAAINATKADWEPARTPHAVSMQASRLGVSVRVPGAGCLTVQDLERLFGCDCYSIRKVIESGDLPARRASDAPRAAWLIERADVERLIRERPWLYDPWALGDGPLADLARLTHRADPWLRAREAAPWMGCSVKRAQAWLHDGRLPSRSRLLGAQGRRSAAGGIRVARRADVLRFAAAVELEIAAGKRRRIDGLVRGRLARRTAAVAS